MKVGELIPGMLIRPAPGMRWVKRQDTLNVEPEHRKIWKYHGKPPIPLGTIPAIYMCYKNAGERITEGLDGYGARIVILNGSLLPVDSAAWHRIEKVEDE